MTDEIIREEALRLTAGIKTDFATLNESLQDLVDLVGKEKAEELCREDLAPLRKLLFDNGTEWDPLATKP